MSLTAHNSLSWSLRINACKPTNHWWHRLELLLIHNSCELPCLHVTWVSSDCSKLVINQKHATASASAAKYLTRYVVSISNLRVGCRSGLRPPFVSGECIFCSNLSPIWISLNSGRRPLKRKA